VVLDWNCACTLFPGRVTTIRAALLLAPSSAVGANLMIYKGTIHHLTATTDISVLESALFSAAHPEIGAYIAKGHAVHLRGT